MHLPLTHDDIVSLLCADQYYHSGTHIDLDAVAPAVLRWIREAEEAAFDAGFTACEDEITKQWDDPSRPITRVNPYSDEPGTFADRMADQSLEAMRAKYPEAPKHSMHGDGEWFYACEACSGMPEGSL